MSLSCNPAPYGAAQRDATSSAAVNRDELVTAIVRTEWMGAQTAGFEEGGGA
jgi:hypothetical protein